MDDETAEQFEQRQRMEGRALEATITSYMGSSEFRGAEQEVPRMLPPDTDAETIELVIKAVQAELIENLITRERTKYTRDYREYRSSRRLAGAGR